MSEYDANEFGPPLADITGPTALVNWRHPTINIDVTPTSFSMELQSFCVTAEIDLQDFSRFNIHNGAIQHF